MLTVKYSEFSFNTILHNLKSVIIKQKQIIEKMKTYRQKNKPSFYKGLPDSSTGTRTPDTRIMIPLL